MFKKIFLNFRTDFRILNLKFICYLVLGICSFLGVSCKQPLPVYFDKPIGIKVQGFDSVIAGNYLPVEDLIDKGEKEFSDRYEIRYDKIIIKDSAYFKNQKANEVNYEEVNNLIGVKKDSAKAKPDLSNCDSLFKTICQFNKLVTESLGNDIDKIGPVKPDVGFLKITYDRIFFIGLDSAGNNVRDTLLQLSPNTVLTKYSGKYFLNFNTPYGWEIMQMDLWENNFMSTRLFYFTDYTSCPHSVAELTASTKNIYPDLKPILNKNKKVAGYRAVLNPKLLLDKFNKSEEVILMFKIK